MRPIFSIRPSAPVTAALAAAAAGALMAGAAPAAAEVVTLQSPHSVSDTLDRLAGAVETAGARIFARVPHSGGAASVGVEMAPMELLIFGNPALGTPAVAAAPHTGLGLPLRVLAYEDGDGQVWLAWDEPAAMLGGYGLDPAAEVVGRIAGALGNLTAAAVAAD